MREEKFRVVGKTIRTSTLLYDLILSYPSWWSNPIFSYRGISALALSTVKVELARVIFSSWKEKPMCFLFNANDRWISMCGSKPLIFRQFTPITIKTRWREKEQLIGRLQVESFWLLIALSTVKKRVTVLHSNRGGDQRWYILRRKDSQRKREGKNMLSIELPFPRKEFGKLSVALEWDVGAIARLITQYH